jgi:hypothetical protein
MSPWRDDVVNVVVAMLSLCIHVKIKKKNNKKTRGELRNATAAKE